MPGNPDIPNLPYPPMPPLETMPFTTQQGIIAIIYDLWLKAQGLNGRIIVSNEVPGAITLELAYDEVFNIPENYYYFTAVKYTIPTGYKFVIVSVTSMSADNRTIVKCNQSIVAGIYDPNTQIFIPSGSVSSPDFYSGIDAKVITTMGNVDDILLTITYTNQDGISGRIATANGIKIKKQIPAGFKISMVLQSGDYGVRSVQNVTADKINTGSIEIQLIKNFFYQRLIVPNATYDLMVPRESIVIQENDFLNIDIGSTGAANTQRMVRLNGYLVPLP